jgi:hypothetical protein
MARAQRGYVYLNSVTGVIKRRAAFKLDGYIYVEPVAGEKPVFYRYHEDTVRDMIAFQVEKMYNLYF